MDREGQSRPRRARKFDESGDAELAVGPRRRCVFEAHATRLIISGAMHGLREGRATTKMSSRTARSVAAGAGRVADRKRPPAGGRRHSFPVFRVPGRPRNILRNFIADSLGRSLGGSVGNVTKHCGYLASDRRVSGYAECDEITGSYPRDYTAKNGSIWFHAPFNHWTTNNCTWRLFNVILTTGKRPTAPRLTASPALRIPPHHVEVFQPDHVCDRRAGRPSLPDRSC